MSEPSDIDVRTPVWEAFSDFFLDTELDERDYCRISETLASSPYDISTLNDILRFEVYPTLIWNLRDVAGEWAGFDRDWLVEQMTPRINKRPILRTPLFQWWMVKDHWNIVSGKVERIRRTR